MGLKKQAEIPTYKEVWANSLILTQGREKPRRGQLRLGGGTRYPRVKVNLRNSEPGRKCLLPTRCLKRAYGTLHHLDIYCSTPEKYHTKKNLKFRRFPGGGSSRSPIQWGVNIRNVVIN